jgi:phosphate transport system substrate-binding protein
MRYILRISGIIFLLALLTTPLVAQDAAIIVVGSGIVQPAFEALAEASGAEVSLSTSVTGTSSGFSQFCGNTADITTATRAISAEENSLCSANNITYFQVALGQEIAALIVNPEADFAVCVTDEQINQIFTPSAQGSVTNWTQVLPEASDIPLSVAAPTDDTSTYAILDQVVEGDGIRGDATLLSSADEIIAQVSENVGAIGVVKLADAVAAGEAVRILDLDAAEVAGCRTPNADSVENNLYPLADRLYAYVNVASLNKPGVTELLEYISSDAAVSVIEAQGIAAPTANALQENRDTLQAAITGEPIVAPVEDFIAPTGIAGTECRWCRHRIWIFAEHHDSVQHHQPRYYDQHECRWRTGGLPPTVQRSGGHCGGLPRPERRRAQQLRSHEHSYAHHQPGQTGGGAAVQRG